MTVPAAVLALLGSLFFALGAALQQFEAASTSRAVLRHLVRRPRWLLGGLAIAVGAVLHVVALKYGPLTVVQPMGVASLLFALPCAAALRRRRPRPGELAAAAVIAIGLIGLVLVVPDQGGDPHLGTGEAVALLTGAATVSLVLWTAARYASPAPRAGLLAMGAGVLYGATATLIRVLVDGDGQFWFLLALPVPALIALALLQRAYAVGHFGVAFAALQVADPLTAVAFGALLLGEPLPTGTASTLTALVAAVLTVAGTVSLARTTPMSPAHDATAR